MDIVFHYSNMPAFVAGDHERKGLGGTENYAVNTARYLKSVGNSVRFYNMQPFDHPTNVEGIYWGNVKDYDPRNSGDILISFRMREVFRSNPNAKHKVLILADTESVGLGNDVRAGLIDTVVAVSKWQMDKIAKEEGLIDHPCWILSSNGINVNEYDNMTYIKDKLDPICIHMSTPERGLGLLLELWPYIVDDIRKFDQSEGSIEPKLYLFSSFFGWGVTEEQNEEMCKGLYDEARRLFNAGYHIYNFKHANSRRLKQAQLNSSFMLYPTNFNETYCISLTECMFAGAIPIVSNRAALAERVEDGYTGYVVGEYESDATSDAVKKEYIDRVSLAIRHNIDDNVSEEYRNYAREYAKDHDYSVVIPNLMKEIMSRL